MSAAAVPPAAPPDAPPTAPPPAVRQARSAALAALLGLLALGLAWELWLAPTGTGTLALKVLPLALCVPGVWRHRMYTYRWLSLLIWLYVMEGVVRAVTERGIGQGLAALEVFLSVLLFSACAVYVRLRLRNGAAAAAAASAASATAADPAPAAAP